MWKHSWIYVENTVSKSISSYKIKDINAFSKECLKSLPSSIHIPATTRLDFANFITADCSFIYLTVQDTWYQVKTS